MSQPDFAPKIANMLTNTSSNLTKDLRSLDSNEKARLYEAFDDNGDGVFQPARVAGAVGIFGGDGRRGAICRGGAGGVCEGRVWRRGYAARGRPGHWQHRCH